MKKQFPGYYSPGAPELRELWDESLLICDAGVFLNLFRCTRETAEACLTLLGEYRSRIWVPYRAAEEYHENLGHMLKREEKACTRALSGLDLLEEIYRHFRGAFLTEPRLERRFLGLLWGLKKYYKERRSLLRSYFSHNPVRDKIAELLEGRVGAPYSSNRLAEIVSLGEERFRHNLPPLPDSGSY